MTAQYVPTAAVPTRPTIRCSPPPTRSRRPASHIVEHARCADSAGGRVGLELEFHLVDLAARPRRPTWAEVQSLAAAAAAHAVAAARSPSSRAASSSCPPRRAPTSRRRSPRCSADRAVLRAGAGAQPASAPRRSAPTRPVRSERDQPGTAATSRWSEHFAALGCAEPGRAMMSATAALQVNLDAGPARRLGAAARADPQPRPGARGAVGLLALPRRRARRAGARCASRRGTASTTAAATRSAGRRPGAALGRLRAGRAGDAGARRRRRRRRSPRGCRSAPGCAAASPIGRGGRRSPTSTTT